ncbi:hypothetical protein [Roseomonas sp. CECT 9278]|uniref:hypothetical protein n=1 Tax=Roseomonas sp. CECT 9278 TaxID=2845823 RepID=UPI001E3B5098|nr:hypothetical protein [Roseomonas sp. CECT 9278]CAH0310167.1 hypothetical protein ROS9278_04898 [Roseomonas sp. CECT 9278]
MGLGIIALLLGLGAAGAGAYIGLATSRLMVALPGGLPALAPETVAMAMVVTGALTMLLGVLSIYRSTEDDSGDVGYGRLAGAIPAAPRRAGGPAGKARRA